MTNTELNALKDGVANILCYLIPATAIIAFEDPDCKKEYRDHSSTLQTILAKIDPVLHKKFQQKMHDQKAEQYFPDLNRRKTDNAI